MPVITISALGKFTEPMEHEIRIIPFTDNSSLTRILVTRNDGELVMRCRCEKWVKALYPHPNGRGYVCSACVGKIKKEIPDVES